MKLLLVTNISSAENPKEESDITYTGVEYYRMVKPHAYMNGLFPEYDIIITPKPEFDLDNVHLNFIKHRDERIQFVKDLIKPFDLIIFNRDIPESTRKLLQEEGKAYALDLDDYWVLPGYHTLHEHYIKNDIKALTEESIRGAKFVTCSTPILAEKIKPFNDNVHVIENGVDFEDPTWQPNKTESNKLRFGFTQSGSHFEDMKVMFKSIRRALENPNFKFYGQIVACGFEKPLSQKALEWKETNVSQAIELEMTNGYALIDNKNYAKALFTWQDYNDVNEIYRRVKATNVLEFGNVYNNFDVSVTYLKDKVFNSCKSELKLLEAGAKGCAVMCNHIKPYTFIANDKNSFDLNKKSFNEWSIYLIKNRNLVSDSAMQLREDIKRYDLKELSVKRNEIYKQYL